MLTLVSFLIALGLLIAVHEYGHYRVAVACGVKVLKFSIGFGKTLYSWKPRKPRPGQDTEFVIGAFPLGGFVKMLDEREGEVPPAERHLAFNTQPLRYRSLIVAAGPAANLLLAVLLYAVVNWYGVLEPQPILASPVAGSLAEQAGVRGGEKVEQGAFSGAELQPLASFEELRWLLTQGALKGHDVRLALAGGREITLPLGRIDAGTVDATLFRTIGILGPWTPPEVVEVLPDGAAARSGLKGGDIVLAIGGTPVVDGQQLFELIRKSVQGGQPRTQLWKVRRGESTVEVTVTPAVVHENGASFGRIGARVGAAPATTLVRHGVVDGLQRGVQRTWEMSALTLQMLGKMVVGQASLKNLSGPITIAEYAGKSASLGLTQYLLYLAVISVSLGVLNLLPIPILDGGHLMYYLWEAVTGKGVSDAWMERLQRGGVAVLLVMMSIALFNDISRHVTRLFG